jgi:type IV secretory pathway TraG/TraD family ATPase VirD4
MERECSRDDPPIIFMLDEFPQLGHMESIMRGVEMGRSAGLKFWFFAQDLQQIGRSYKPEDEAVILGSCVVQCFMNISTRETAQAVSQRLGTTRSVFAGTTRPLIPPEELLNSAKWKSKILCLRRQDEPLVLEKCMFKDML